jgi:hypothetical protein
MGKTWPGVREHLPLNHRRTRSKPGEPTAPDRVAATWPRPLHGPRLGQRAIVWRMRGGVRSQPHMGNSRYLQQRTVKPPPLPPKQLPPRRSIAPFGTGHELRAGMSDMGAVRDAYTLTVLERRFGDLKLFEPKTMCPIIAVRDREGR